jgi:NTP pyrophosphatase (non-canonical NTP hydrolase)
MRVDQIPPKVISRLDELAGMEHRREGRVMRALAECLTLYDDISRTSYAAMLDEWSEATGGDSRDREEWAALREKLIAEEYDEVIEALHFYVQTGDSHKLAKELADLVYVCFGTAQRPGINLDTAFRLVHRSNMAKIHSDGTYQVREDGKILKPDTYVPPNMSPAID